ncbi:putative dual-specificity kinase [Helianthus annuus]|nr:putative dual-specificity kinase [Helianthus annuus]KAJ0877002.1 putative dual-specificity kinase [Helianthus annuus]
METQRTVEFPHHNLDKRPRKRPRSAWDVPDHVIPHPKFVDYGSEDWLETSLLIMDPKVLPALYWGQEFVNSAVPIFHTLQYITKGYLTMVHRHGDQMIKKATMYFP